jgi:hypothetical protein
MLCLFNCVDLPYGTNWIKEKAQIKYWGKVFDKAEADVLMVNQQKWRVIPMTACVAHQSLLPH